MKAITNQRPDKLNWLHMPQHAHLQCVNIDYIGAMAITSSVKQLYL
jgi:hypothetical protein